MVLIQGNIHETFIRSLTTNYEVLCIVPPSSIPSPIRFTMKRKLSMFIIEKRSISIPSICPYRNLYHNCTYSRPRNLDLQVLRHLEKKERKREKKTKKERKIVSHKIPSDIASIYKEKLPRDKVVIITKK